MDIHTYAYTTSDNIPIIFPQFEEMIFPTRVKLGTKTGPTFQYSLFKGFYITKKYQINIYYTKFKLFIHFGYIDIKIDN